MSMEKMTDEERSKIEEFVEAGHTLSEDQASALLVEVDRVRASEAEKDAQIKVLADALMLARELGMSTQTAWDATTAALRLVGRLK